MNTTRFLFVGIASLLTLAGCAEEAEQTEVTEGAATAAAGPFNCTLTVKETIPVKKVSFQRAADLATPCGEGGIPESQITNTEVFNEAPAGAEVACASHSGGPTSTGVAIFRFVRTVVTSEFTMTAQCHPEISVACFAKLAGKDVNGHAVMIHGSSGDQSDRGTVIGTLVPRLDVAAGTFNISVLGAHSFSGTPGEDFKSANGQGAGLFEVSASKIELSTIYDAKKIDSFALLDRIELSCTR